MARILVLDDNRLRAQAFRRALIGHVVIHVSTAVAAVKELEARKYDVVFLDHDLDEFGLSAHTAGTGMDVVRQLVRNRSFPGFPNADSIYIVHSANPDRAPEMADALRDANYDTLLRSGAWNDEDLLVDIVTTLRINDIEDLAPDMYRSVCDGDA